MKYDYTSNNNSSIMKLQLVGLLNKWGFAAIAFCVVKTVTAQNITGKILINVTMQCYDITNNNSNNKNKVFI